MEGTAVAVFERDRWEKGGWGRILAIDFDFDLHLAEEPIDSAEPERSLAL